MKLTCVITWKVFGWQLIGILVIIAWGVGFCTVLFGLLKMFKILRVDSRIEVHGMDSVKHGEPAYPAESWEEQQYWDHQAHRLVHLLSAGNVGNSDQKISADSMTSINLGSQEGFPATGMPPQMNFAHLVLTDHFQKCVLTLDSRRTGWNYESKK